MLHQIASREFKRHVKSVPFALFALILFALVLVFVVNTDPNTVFLAIPIGREFHNAPLLIAKVFAVLSAFGMLITMVMVGKCVIRDFFARTHEFFYTAPVSKTAYLFGRFAGSLTANGFLYVAVVLGFLAGCASLDASYTGPFNPISYLIPIGLILIPNLFLVGAVFFGLATLSRRMMLTYILGVAFTTLYFSLSAALSRIDSDAVRIMLDPFCFETLQILTRNWTVADMNLYQIPVNGLFILNRIVWIGAGFAMLTLTWRKFEMHAIHEGRHRPSNDVQTDELRIPAPLPHPVPDFSTGSQIHKCLLMTAREAGRILRHPAFIILSILAMGTVVLNFVLNVDSAGSSVQPLTSWYLRYANMGWGFMIPLMILFGGMVIWRERDHGMHPFLDTMPMPDWTGMISKIGTLISIQAVYVVLLFITGVFTQIVVFNYTDLEIGLYLSVLFGIVFISYWHMAVVVIFIQNLVPSKTAGFFFSALYFIGELIIFEFLRVDHVFLRYGHLPSFIYSDINGFGHYAPIIFWYTVYWIFLAGILLGITTLLWRRDEETRLKFRLRVAKKRWTRRHTLAFGTLIVLFLSAGGHIIYNKFILNRYLSIKKARDIDADYEISYGRFRHRDQPVLTHIGLNVDFDTDRRDCRIRGRYILQNKSDVPIDTVLINLTNRRVTRIHRLEWSRPAGLIHDGPETGLRLFRLENPLLPGAGMELHFDLEFQTVGFTDNNPKNELASNGSCLVLSTFGLPHYFPKIGYDLSRELSDPVQRRKRHLPDKPPVPPLEEADLSSIDQMSVFVTYDAIITTSVDQTAVTNGNLVSRRTENGRNVFHYKSDVPMKPEILIASQRFVAKRMECGDRFIEVFYHHRHDYNIDRMLRGTADALAYGHRNFSPYPFASVRIPENTEYMDFGGARAFPSIVQWREMAGFISRFEEDDIDRVYFIAAHELAHHWWGCAITPADAEGSIMTTETLAQYTALLLLEKAYGRDITDKFLESDMEDYLEGRKNDVRGERPLIRSYHNYYTTYAKSNIVMAALREYIGEERMNRGLRAFLADFENREDRHPTSLDVVRVLRSVTPDSLKYLITDLFETITLWENKALSASVEKINDDNFELRLVVETYKFRADSIGNQTEVPIDDVIEVDIRGKEGKSLYRKMRRFIDNRTELLIRVDEEPLTAGIDPRGLLIDRNRDDNLVRVKK